MSSSKMSMSLLNNDGDDVDVFFLSRKLISLGSRSHQAHSFKKENYDIDSTKLFVQQFTVNLLIKLTNDKNREFACQ